METIRKKKLLSSSCDGQTICLKNGGVPHKLLLVTTRNIKNAELERIFFANIEAVESGCASHTFVEIDRKSVRIHF